MGCFRFETRLQSLVSGVVVPVNRFKAALWIFLRLPATIPSPETILRLTEGFRQEENVDSLWIRGSNSAGRVRPCQGRCRRFESGLPLQKKIYVTNLTRFC